MTLKNKIEVDRRYIRPINAEKKMKLAQGIHQTIWLYGVTGCGKTSFCMDILKKHRHRYYSISKTLPEEIDVFELISQDNIVVFDDLQGIFEEDIKNAWVTVIQQLVAEEKVWVIIISRADIPSWLRTLSIQYGFYRIEEEDFMLNRGQLEEYYHSYGIEQIDEKILTEAIRLGSGNPLWHKIVAMEYMRGDLNQIIMRARNSFWEYIIAYVYAQWDPDFQEIMIKLSILGEFDLETAMYTTNLSNVNLWIERGMELGNFIEVVEQGWKIRKPMRFAIKNRLVTTYDMQYVNTLMIRAGDCLRVKGRYMDALILYEEAGSEQSIAELLIQHAKETPGTGFYNELRSFYLKLSDSYIKKSSVLMAGMSMLQSMLMNIEESERWYQELKEYVKIQKGTTKKEAESRLIYLEIALPHRGGVGILQLIKQITPLLLSRKLKIPEISVTSNLPSQMNGGKDFCEWSKNDRELAKVFGKPLSIALGRYGKALVDLALAESYFEKGYDNFEVELLANRARMQAESVGNVEQIFVAVAILAELSAATDHMENAIELLDSFSNIASNSSIHLKKNLNTLQCRMALYRGRKAEILEWMKEAPNENEEFYTMDRFRYLTKVRIYLAENRLEEAGRLLQKLLIYSEKMKRTYISMEANLLLSILQYRDGREDWQSTMQGVITRTEEYHFVRLISKEGSAVKPLLQNGKFEWKDSIFKKQVEQEVNRMANMYPSYLHPVTAYAEVEFSENALSILRLQAMGKSGEEIAKQLNISLATVKYHNKETYRKLEVKTKAQAVNEARNRGLI